LAVAVAVAVGTVVAVTPLAVVVIVAVVGLILVECSRLLLCVICSTSVVADLLDV